MCRPIAISLSPNAEKDDVLLALKTLFSPGKWLDQEEVEKFEKEFADKFGENYKAIAVNSGRSAEYLILKALGIGKEDEVATQAFTCVAVPNSIIWLGAGPVYIDIDETYNIDPADLEKKISSKTRVIIVQHTFGVPADLDSIKKIAQRRKIYLVEDCSHSLGALYKGKKVGTVGDVAFFSFGRDKVLSSVFGGMILCSNEALYKKIRTLRDDLEFPPKNWVVQQLFHPIVFSFILPLYNLGIGKLFLLLLQKIRLLSKAVYKREKLTRQPNVFPSKTPGGLAMLARNQLKKLDKFNKHRREVANFYASSLKGSPLHIPPMPEGSIWLRFPIRHKKAGQLYKFAKKQGILLGDWYKGVVMPVEDLSLVGYKKGSCPVAEEYARTVINLPTYPMMTRSQARKVVKIIKQWLNTK